MEKKMTSKQVLNMKVKDLIEYCENHKCKNCPFEKICVFEDFEGQEHTLISILAGNIREMEENE